MITEIYKIPHATKAILAIVLIMLFVSLYADFSATFWGDQDWDLLVCAMLLHGKKLYVDQVTVVGPLLFYIQIVPVFISQHLNFLEDYQALVLFILFIIVGVIAVCTRIIQQHPGFSEPSRRLQWVLLLCFLLIIRVYFNFFGDREHLLVILSLPYLLRFMPGLTYARYTLRMRILVGGLAALGFFIKPHCLLVCGGIQIIHVIYTRSLKILYSPENITIYILGLLYGLTIWVFTPEYFTVVLPFAYFTYSALQSPAKPLFNTVLAIILTYAMWRPKSDSVYRRDIYYFSAILPFLWLYIHFNNGWGYTYLPFMTILFLVNGWVLWDFLSQKPTFTFSSWKALLGIVLCMINFGVEILYQGNFASKIWIHSCRGDAKCPGSYKVLTDEVDALHARSFGTIGTDFTTWTRVSKITGAQWDTRFPQLWMLPKLIIADNDFYEKHKGILFYVADALADDLNHNKPPIVFVERFEVIYSMQFEKPIDLIELLSTASSFTQAWGHYKLVHTVDNCASYAPSTEAIFGYKQPPKYNCRFDVFERTDAKPSK